MGMMMTPVTHDAPHDDEGLALSRPMYRRVPPIVADGGHRIFRGSRLCLCDKSGCLPRWVTTIVLVTPVRSLVDRRGALHSVLAQCLGSIPSSRALLPPASRSKTTTAIIITTQ